MIIGDIFTWDDFPFPKNGAIKDRWFLYLGEGHSEGDVFAPFVSFLNTTTTQLSYYEDEGDRCQNLHILFKESDGYGFERDSILDVDQDFSSIDHNVFKDAETKNKILKVGAIPHSVLNKVYSLICKSKNIDWIVKKTIHDNLSAAGINGLSSLPPKRSFKIY